jgi:hypothetical protein
MADTEIQEYPITCPKCGEGKIEAATTIYLEIAKARIHEDGTVEIIDLSYYSGNDFVNGMPLNMEAELRCSCDHCGAELDWDISFEFRNEKLAPQPIGNSKRRIGVRGGTLDAVAIERHQIELQLIDMAVGETTSYDVFDIEREENGWTVWDEGEHYNYDDITSVIDHIQEGMG